MKSRHRAYHHRKDTLVLTYVFRRGKLSLLCVFYHEPIYPYNALLGFEMNIISSWTEDRRMNVLGKDIRFEFVFQDFMQSVACKIHTILSFSEIAVLSSGLKIWMFRICIYFGMNSKFYTIARKYSFISKFKMRKFMSPLECSTQFLRFQIGPDIWHNTLCFVVLL